MWDAAVIGGGPAGCAAALTLRSSGMATTVIGSRRSREKPTETAVPRLKSLLQSIGASEALTACEPCYGIESSWGADGPALKPSILDASGHAWFVHRARFDASLMQLVEIAGVVKLQAEAINIRFADDHVTVITDVGPVEARSLVIATGSPAWTAVSTGQKPLTIDSLICYWGRLNVPIKSRLLHVESTENGWWYVCTGEANTAVACFLTDTEGSRQLDPAKPTVWNSLFQETRLCQQHALGQKADKIRSLPVNVASLAIRFGPRWVVAGDAAIKLDPIGSSGTATALDSGIRAARALVACREGDDATAIQYEQWGNRLVAEFLRHRTPLYQAELEKYPASFWSRR